MLALTPEPDSTGGEVKTKRTLPTLTCTIDKLLYFIMEVKNKITLTIMTIVTTVNVNAFTCRNNNLSNYWD
jgi:hypothetical protein